MVRSPAVKCLQNAWIPRGVIAVVFFSSLVLKVVGGGSLNNQPVEHGPVAAIAYSGLAKWSAIALQGVIGLLLLSSAWRRGLVMAFALCGLFVVAAVGIKLDHTNGSCGCFGDYYLPTTAHFCLLFGLLLLGAAGLTFCESER